MITITLDRQNRTGRESGPRGGVRMIRRKKRKKRKTTNKREKGEVGRCENQLVDDLWIDR